jgi:hypothetical protein
MTSRLRGLIGWLRRLTGTARARRDVSKPAERDDVGRDIKIIHGRPHDRRMAEDHEGFDRPSAPNDRGRSDASPGDRATASPAILDRPDRRRTTECVCVVLGATLVIALLIATGGDSQDLRGDQEEINLIVEKRLHPEILPRDALYGSYVIDLYTPSFIRLQAAASQWVGGDPVAALRLLIWPLGFLYLVGHYVLFRSLTGCALAAALGAISALTVRNALAGEYWGFDGLRAIQPRTVLAGMTPLLLLAFLRWRHRRGFPLYFFGLGLLFNVHPVGALHLAQVTAVGHLWLQRFRRHAWRQVVVGAPLFAIGALPLARLLVTRRQQLTEPSTLAELRSALALRFSYTFYPIPIDTIVSVTIHALLLLGVTVWLLRLGAVGSDLMQLLALAAVAVLLGLGGTAAIQGAALLTNRPYVDVLEMRTSKFVYPILLCALATFYASLLSRKSFRGYLALVGVCLFTLVPPQAMIHSVSRERRDAIKRVLGGTALSHAEAAPTESLAPPPALLGWARTSIPQDALVMTDLDEFRVQTLRSITGTVKDGGWQYVGGSRPFHAWYTYIRDVEHCRHARGRDCWFELALRYRADHVLVDPGVADATPTEDFRRIRSDDHWSVWRRRI